MRDEKSKKTRRTLPIVPPPVICDTCLVTHTPGDGDRGWLLYNSTEKSSGIYFVADAGLNIDIPATAVSASTGNQITLYTPTNLSPGGACIEVSTRHERVTGSTTSHALGFWDWCLDQQSGIPGANGTIWGTVDPMTPAWQANFVRILPNGRASYLAQVFKRSDGCWEALLYNWTQVGWEHKWTSCGTTRIGAWDTTGWTMWESYGLSGQCPTLSGVSESSILTMSSSGMWYGMDIGGNYAPIENGSVCFTNATYGFESPTATDGGNSWHANTPNP